MHQLPPNDSLPVAKLSAVFNDVTNSYKYYWFLAILEMIEERKGERLAYTDLCLKMLDLVWYPLETYKLSFGALDSFKKLVPEIAAKTKIDGFAQKYVSGQLYDTLNKTEIDKISREIKKLLLWVPYRFQSPFFAGPLWKATPDPKKNNLIESLAEKDFEARHYGSIYKYEKDAIVLHPSWAAYLADHLSIMKAFVCWHLAVFLQKNNPNVVGIPNKLFKPEHRDLNGPKKLWNHYVEANPMRCIYSGAALAPGGLSIDHFVPWSYVTHDRLWNLIPTTKSVNSSKNDALPDMDRYLDPFADGQRDFFRFLFEHNDRLPSAKNAMLEYGDVFKDTSSAGIYELDTKFFRYRINGVLRSLAETAKNMGFREGWGV